MTVKERERKRLRGDGRSKDDSDGKEVGGAKMRGRSMRQEEGGGTCCWLALALVGTDPPLGEGDREPHAGATVPRSSVGAACV